jgi:lysophospholipid acyltransferase (LPLAT)-like uncharacterized protein
VPTSAPAARPPADLAREGGFTRWQRFLLRLITWAGYLLIRVLGSTLRYSISIEDGGPPHWYVASAIYPFWHRCLIPACFLWREKKIAVLTSKSFDGEYIARILEAYGYTPVRGSSTRGGARALLGMQKELESGNAVAFTADGPKGPMYVAKSGPVLLARITGSPVLCFHIALESPWVLPKSWDRFMIPKPFSRAMVRISKLIYLPPDADIDRYRDEVQAALDRAREYAEANVGRAEPGGGRRIPFDSPPRRQ